MSIGVAELGIALAAGGLSTLSPCVFPVLPLVVGGAIQNNRLGPLIMGSGMVFSFTLIGVAIGVLGDSLGLNGDNVRLVGALLIILFGLAMLIPKFSGIFASLLNPIANAVEQSSHRLNTKTLISTFFFGSVLGMVWSPCSGPLLASAVTLVASEGGAVRGGVILGMFGLGAAAPLMLIAYSSQRIVDKSRKFVMSHIYFIQKFFGCILLIAGFAILLGWDKKLEAMVLDLMPDSWVNFVVIF